MSTEAKIATELAARLEAALIATMTGGPAPAQRPTALRLRGRSFETVELDDAGNAIEPPPRCPRCGPIFLCSTHSVAT
ncbi:hypothetical protein [Bradyrhizobium sp. 153]|uniref:hypothetical protein n=1 Tax=Bradyrhizobium sp. 153 TaxID=2782627 RepID=UPI001FFB8670|nr:hypothetical protein [Bradyrhizobium sp. 153]MCK1669399.1 hypothetical protein [Bradyrhizobium sp. 153]